MQQEKHDFVSCEKQLREMLASEHLDSGSSDLLFELIDDYIGAATVTEMDAELVSACFARLRELQPEQPQYDEEAGLKKLKASIQAQSTDRSRKLHRSSRFVSILVAVVALLVVAATAFGGNPFNYISRLAETVSFRLTSSGEMVLPPEQESDYYSLQEALDANEVDIKMPRWIPPEYSLSTVESATTGDRTYVFTAIFAAGDKELQIDISSYPAEKTFSYENEKDEDEITYEVNGQTYFIIPNTDSISVFWRDGNYIIQLYGHITESEAKHIINSID